MNIEKARARRHQVLTEQQELFEGAQQRGSKTLTPRQAARFDELQSEFRTLSAEIAVEEAKQPRDSSEAIRPMPAGSLGYDGRDNQAGEEHRRWGREVASKIMESRGLDVSASGVATPAFFDPNLRTLPWGALSVRGLIPSVKVETVTVQAVRQKVGATGRDNNAAPVAHGDEKPESVIGIERVDVNTARSRTSPSRSRSRSSTTSMASCRSSPTSSATASCRPRRTRS